MQRYLVVGAGFAGAVVARQLADAGGDVFVVDRRPQAGGNAADAPDAYGVIIHPYGPHIFHTNSDEVWAYLSRFTAWRPYEHRVLADVGGRLVPMPVGVETVNRLFDLALDEAGFAAWLAAARVPGLHARTAEAQVRGTVGDDLYRLLFRGYTRKQWGLDPAELDASVTARIPVRMDRDERYFTDVHQAMPRDGYAALFASLLDHPRITLALMTEVQALPAAARRLPTIWTGPLDEYFDWQLGRLPYRSLRWEYRTAAGDVTQPAATINEPDEAVPYTRVTEFRQLTGQQSAWTTLAYEYPQAQGEPFYPMPTPAARALAADYRALAAQAPGVWFVGRLGTYQYYNMDQVVAQALVLSRRLLSE